MSLNPKERRFAELHVLDGKSMKAAAIEAGYSESVAHSRVSEWLRKPRNEGGKPELQQYVEGLRRELSKGFESERVRLREFLRSAVFDGEITQAKFYGGEDAPPVALSTQERLSAARDYAKMIGAYDVNISINQPEKADSVREKLEQLSVEELKSLKGALNESD